MINPHVNVLTLHIQLNPLHRPRRNQTQHLLIKLRVPHRAPPQCPFYTAIHPRESRKDHFYQLTLIFLVLATYKPGPSRQEIPEAQREILRLILFSTYFWAGVQKLNHEFIQRGFPSLITLTLPSKSPLLTELLPVVAVWVALLEAGGALALLFPRTRRIAGFLIILMHLCIVAGIGPWGLRWNSIVWPWNIGMAALVFVLFVRDREGGVRAVLLNTQSTVHGFVFLVFTLCPIMNFFEMWPDYFSHALYSCNVKRGIIEYPANLSTQLPPMFQAISRAKDAATMTMDINDWAYAELNAPCFTVEPVFHKAARTFCDTLSGGSEGVILVIMGRSGMIDGGCDEKSYRPCPPRQSEESSRSKHASDHRHSIGLIEGLSH